MSGAMALSMPAEHVEHLAAIDQWYWWHRVRWRAVRWAIARLAGRRIFACYYDVGSGGGGLAGFLAHNLTLDCVVLFDQYPVPAEKLQRLGVPRLTQRSGDLERLSLEGMPPPDLVTCLDVLEHLDHPEELLRRVRDAALGQAWLVVTVPAMAGLWSSWDEQAGHRRRYDRRGLVRLLERGGWRVAHCRYLFHACVLPVWWHRRVLRARGPLAFPSVPCWLNRLLEWACWFEFVSIGWLRLPFGTSLLAVAAYSGPQKDGSS